MPKLRPSMLKVSEDQKSEIDSKYPSMEKIYAGAKTILPVLRVGEIAGGTVIERGNNILYLDLGIFGTGIIYGQEYLDSRNLLADKKSGDKIFAKIIDIENEQGYIELSAKEAGRELNWQTLAQKKEARETIETKIMGANRGGLVAEMQGISAFMPVSQLSFSHYPKVENGDPSKILEELRKFIGKTLNVRIIDINQTEEKLILSERAQEREELNKILAQYKIGDIVEGEVTGIVNFGAFVAFPVSSAPNASSPDAKENGNKLEGLIHISELDWKLVKHPSALLKIGDKAKVKIVDISDGKISLSLKALKPDPWEETEKKYKKGDVFAGVVIKFNPFGAFVEFPDGLQGLCHISEFGSRKRMEEALEIGKGYNFKVLLLDAENHKISLGMTEEIK